MELTIPQLVPYLIRNRQSRLSWRLRRLPVQSLRNVRPSPSISLPYPSSRKSLITHTAPPSSSASSPSTVQPVVVSRRLNGSGRHQLSGSSRKIPNSGRSSCPYFQRSLNVRISLLRIASRCASRSVLRHRASLALPYPIHSSSRVRSSMVWVDCSTRQQATSGSSVSSTLLFLYHRGTRRAGMPPPAARCELSLARGSYTLIRMS